MKISIEKLEKCQTKVTVVAETEEWKKAQDKAFKQIAAKTEVKGFRKGHVPEAILKKSVSQNEVMRNATDLIVDEAYKKAVSENNLKIFYQPELNITKLDEENLEFEIIVIGQPEVKLGGYTNIKVDKEKVEVTEDEIKDAILKLLEQNAELEVVEDGILENGNTAVIDFEGFVDNVPFEGGKAENYSLEIGSGSFIPGFEDQLIGMKPEEESEIKVKFPEQYAENLAGKDATFKVKLHEIKRKVVPELSDDFAKEANIENVSSVEELNTYFHDTLLKDKETKAEQDAVKELVSLICEKAEFEIAKKVLDEEAQYMINNFKGRVEQSGLKYEDYLKNTNTKEEDLLKQAREEASKQLKEMFVLHEIGVKENITVTNEEVDAEIKKMADMYHMGVEDVKKALGDRLNQFTTDIRNNKIINFLKENNKIA